MSDPPRPPDDDDQADEGARLFRHDLRVWASKQPPQPGQPPVDPIHIMRAHFRGTPRDEQRYFIGRWSIIARFIDDASRPDSEFPTDQAVDVGPAEAWLGRRIDAASFSRTFLGDVGITYAGRWVRWALRGSPPDRADLD